VFQGQSEAANWRKSAEDAGEAVALRHCGTKEHTMSADELLNVVDAANYLGIRPWTLRHWVSDGKIEIVKYGNGIVRIRRSVLDRFVASCTIKARTGHGSTSDRSKESRLLEGTSVGRGEESLAR
jgi:excisionase family DNA binding protein